MKPPDATRNRPTAFLAVAALLAACGGCSQATPGASAPAAAATSASVGPREFAVEGMSCQGCVETLTDALKELPGVKSVEVSLEKKHAVVVADESAVPTAAIEAAIAKAGYQGRLAITAKSP